MSLTRRTFVKASAVLAAADPLAAFASPSFAMEREPLRQFDYSQVRLTGGPFAAQYDVLHAHYLTLSRDRLLKGYRQRAGLPAPGADMGGWYDPDGFVPGHSLGQYISGLARIGASTGDRACHQMVHDLVGGFAATLGKDNQSILHPMTNLWTCYILDKHFAGLIDAATLSNLPEAKELLNRVLEGSQSLLPAKGRDRIGKKDPPYDETFVMPENLFAAAELTGNSAFRELAERYLLNRELFDPLARGEDPFPSQHAYSHAIALSSAGKAWLTLGDLRYKLAMQNAFQLLTNYQQFSSGGWGPNETFITPHKGELFASLSTAVDHFETPCGAYAATKLARYLIRTSQIDTRYGDNLERVLFNTILAVKPPDSDGDYPYYSTYSPAAQKVYYKMKWPCCSGTLVQTVADYPLNAYFHAKDGLYVNLYIPSELSFEQNGVGIRVVQQTRYPAEDTTEITLHPAQDAAFTVYLRIPAWLTSAAAITVNHQPVEVMARPGSFAALHRTWSAGDTIRLILPQSFRVEAIDDLHLETVALMRGPVLYVAVNPSAELSHKRLSLPAGLKQVASQAFVENYEGRPIVFVPLHAIQNETYTTYFNRS